MPSVMWKVTVVVILCFLGFTTSMPIGNNDGACQNGQDTIPETQPNFNIDQFMGVWYVLARTNGPWSPRYSWDGSTYKYTRYPDGSITGLFSFVKSDNAGNDRDPCLSSVQGKLITTGQNAVLNATVLGTPHPLSGQYVIMYTDYNFAVTRECYDPCQGNGKIISILSRSRELPDEDVFLFLKGIAEKQICRGEQLIHVSHVTSCEYQLEMSPERVKRDIEEAAELAAREFARELGVSVDEENDDVMIEQTHNRTDRIDGEGSGEMDCPELNCWDGPCLYNSVKDVNGCDTCECVRPEFSAEPCDTLECPACAFGSFKNRKGCDSCKCKDASLISCPKLECNLTCDFGYKEDANGCAVCNCSNEANPICPQLHCEKECEYGLIKDGRGCSTCGCQCDDNLNCWDGPCTFGSELDKDGCETCECLRSNATGETCPDLECPPCPIGSFRDKNGCESCHCKNIPQVACRDMKELCDLDCEFGYKKDEFNCDLCMCSDVAPKCVEIFCENNCTRRNKGPHGCDVCECDCPELNCWDGPCSHGSELNADGCETCECKNSRLAPCPPADCPPCEFGSYKDRSGCDTCRCKDLKEVACTQLNCSAPCEFGYKKDEFGCKTCVCNSEEQEQRCLEIYCENSCSTYRMKDANGCDTCECACQETDCWDGPCLFGSVQDDSGCETCECLQSANSSNECPELLCSGEPCTYGSFTDSSGCPSCICKSPPEESCRTLEELSCNTTCPNGYAKDELGCYSCECFTTRGGPFSPDGRCPFLECDKDCVSGFRLGEPGCPICECADKGPYENITCIEPVCENTCEYERATDEAGCKTCECTCPSLDCWDGPCLYKSLTDLSGCDTCECLRPDQPKISCPLLECPEGPCQHGSFPDREGCDSCRCKQQPEITCPRLDTCALECPFGLRQNPYGCFECACSDTEVPTPVYCPLLQCDKTCTHGLKRDDNGCHKCECECPPPLCPRICKHGYQVDESGCPTCSCMVETNTGPSEIREKCPPTPFCENDCKDGRVKDQHGCETCECACPTLNCWDGPCLFGSIKDPKGCETCECLRPKQALLSCPFLSCEGGPCKHGSYPDKKGCSSCECKDLRPENLCAVDECELECPNGFVTDENGCNKCECIPEISPPVKCQLIACPLKCPNGYREDEQGCLTCECRCEPPICWDGPCRYGSELDINGCPTCECKRPINAAISCGLLDCRHRKCQNGFDLNRFGCLSCHCRAEIVEPEGSGELGELPDGCDDTASCPFHCLYGNKEDHKGCKTCECKEMPVAPKEKCPVRECRNTCENGFANDEYGCETCICLLPQPNDCRQDCVAICGHSYKMKKDENGCEVCTCLPDVNDIFKLETDSLQNDAPGLVEVTWGVTGPEEGHGGDSETVSISHGDVEEVAFPLPMTNANGGDNEEPNVQIAASGAQRSSGYQVVSDDTQTEITQGDSQSEPWYRQGFKFF